MIAGVIAGVDAGPGEHAADGVVVPHPPARPHAVRGGDRQPLAQRAHEAALALDHLAVLAGAQRHKAEPLLKGVGVEIEHGQFHSLYGSFCLDALVVPALPCGPCVAKRPLAMTDPFAPPEIERVPVPRAACDGASDLAGLASLGHPRVWLQIGPQGFADCGYCDRRFVLIGGPADVGSEGDTA